MPTISPPHRHTDAQPIRSDVAPPRSSELERAAVATPTPAPTVLTRARASTSRRAAAARHFASDVGQGTVEYVGLLLLMATVLAAVVAAASNLGGEQQIGKKVVTQVGKSIDRAGGE